MARPPFNAVLDRSLRLTRRLLTHHMLLQEFMPEHPLLQQAGVRAETMPGSGLRSVQAAARDSESEESIAGWREPSAELFGEDPEAAEQTAAEPIVPSSDIAPPPAQEVPAHQAEHARMLPLSISPAAPSETAVQAAGSEVSEPVPRARRPWKQRIAEIDATTEAQSAEETPSEETLRTLQEAAQTAYASPAAIAQTAHDLLASAVQPPVSAESPGGRQQTAAAETPAAVQAAPEMPVNSAVLPPAEVPAEQTKAVRAAYMPAEETAPAPTAARSTVKKQKKPAGSQAPDSASAAENQDSQTAETLFADTGQDRSPQAWAARMAAVRRPVSPADAFPSRLLSGETLPASEAAPPVSEAMPLRETSRRFLEPLAGIDPANAHIHQGPIAEQMTSALHADALTQGTDIFLGAGQATDTPEGLGLLAHELTHVARNRMPDFIPPIARPGLTPQRREKPAAVTHTPMNEEALALHVEARVRSAARQAGQERPGQPIDPVQAAPAAEPSRAFLFPEEAGTLPVSGDMSLDSPDAALPWAGLPAPWEPMPFWIAPSSSGPLSETVQMTAEAPVMGTMGREVQLAGEDRSIEAPAEAAAPAPAHAAAAPPEAELDRLAQQVYTRLKQRLSAERRREWR